MKQKIVVPYAPILVESTRSIGYSFEAALADIIDNSIGKGAREVHVKFDSTEPQYVAIIDDACGMDEAELETAMRYGSKSAAECRDADDLGRFGLGLKMASMSQCRKLTVATKKDGKIYAARWDLDYIIKQGDWALLTYSDDEIATLRFVEMLQEATSGTIVYWEDFDRIANGAVNMEKVFDEKLDLARNHIALVFHRFMGIEVPSQRVQIFFNNDKVEPADPFLTGNAATQPMVEQSLIVDGSEIKVKPYILPFVSKLSAKDKRQVGDINDLRQNQGFYIYRNRRLIIWGTWFRLIKQYELNKLARIRVDIPNTLDSLWEIDIKKSSASLPDIIKKNLAAIVENAVGRSETVYKYRGRKVNADRLQHIWNTVDDRGTFQYLINRELPLVKQLESCLSEEGQRYLDSLIKTLEDAFPYSDVYYRLAKNENSAQSSPLEFDKAYQVAVDMIASVRSIGGDIPVFLATMDQLDFFVKYPDVVSKVREDFAND